MVTDSDWKNRILCSDGNCIGVIGSDGQCKECGLKYEGTLPDTLTDDNQSRPEREDESEADMAEQPQAEADAASDAQDTASDAHTDDDDWSNRQLCSDGNCIGVIGPDGRCKECGKALE
jgi:hypothetical protein